MGCFVAVVHIGLWAHPYTCKQQHMQRSGAAPISKARAGNSCLKTTQRWAQTLTVTSGVQLLLLLLLSTWLVCHTP
jgi:hypothetical protein